MEGLRLGDDSLGSVLNVFIVLFTENLKANNKLVD